MGRPHLCRRYNRVEFVHGCVQTASPRGGAGGLDGLFVPYDAVGCHQWYGCRRTSLAAAGKEYHNLSAVVSDYYVNADYVSLTQEQWLEEISELLERSWKKYQQFPGSSPAYHREMEKNYPKFSSILERLAQNTKCCEVVRMNQYGGDDTVWYFGRAQDDFCIMRVSDSM